MSDLKNQIESLKQRIEDRAYEADKKASNRWDVKASQDIGSLSRFVSQVILGAHWVHERMVAPTGRFLAVPMAFLFGWYRRLWARLVYVEDRFQQRQFSKTRAGLTLAGTFVFVWFLMIPLLVFAFDVALYFATVKHDEIVYLNNSQEVLPEENVHAVQGCHSLPCTDENSFYFRIRATLFNEAWSLVHGYGFFFPDYVAAAVPVSISQCKITSYGLRMKLMMRGIDVYPDILRTECTPLLGPTNP